MEKETTTKYVLYANALLLILGTLVQGISGPFKSVELSGLFVTWFAVCVWYMHNTTKSQSLD